MSTKITSKIERYECMLVCIYICYYSPNKEEKTEISSNPNKEEKTEKSSKIEKYN